MKKLICVAIFTLLANTALAEDLTDKAEEATPVSTDIVYMVDDPGGTPADKKVTLDNLGKGIGNVDAITLDGKAWGTLTDTKYCVYDLGNLQIKCTETPAGSGDLTDFVTNVPTGDVSVDEYEKLIPGTIGLS